MKLTRIRDLSLIDTNPPLVLATDSIGGIGLKPNDVLAVDPVISGYFLARVPIFEIICFGATPISYVLTSSNEMKPTTEQLLHGVRRAFEPFQLVSDHENGSTEENMATSMTAAGITVLAELPVDWIQPVVHDGDDLYLLGRPLVGADVLQQPDQLAQLDDLIQLRSDPRIGVMVPLGSKGISHELDQLGIALLEPVRDLIHQSGGPASAIIFSASTKLPDLELVSPCQLLGSIQVKKNLLPD